MSLLFQVVIFSTLYAVSGIDPSDYGLGDDDDNGGSSGEGSGDLPTPSPTTQTSDEEKVDQMRELVRDHMVVSVIGVFLMAFVGFSPSYLFHLLIQFD